MISSGGYKPLGTEFEIEDRRGNPRSMIPLDISVRVTLELLTKAKTWFARVRLASSIVSLATNPEATTTSCEFVQDTIRTILYIHVPSEYEALKTVVLPFTATKVGLSYVSGYRGTLVQVPVSHADETIHKSDDPVSNSTLRLMLPVSITA